MLWQRVISYLCQKLNIGYLVHNYLLTELSQLHFLETDILKKKKTLGLRWPQAGWLRGKI
jgi:hypothetical protein